MMNIEEVLELNQTDVLSLANLRDEISDLDEKLGAVQKQTQREVDTVYNILFGLLAGLILAFVSVLLSNNFTKKGGED
jgi:tetrahydromethanopterin S-methyltransferase subunit G